MNLYELLKSQDFKGLDSIFIRKIAFQILISLSLLKSQNMIHCDLKPENILLCRSDTYDIKVIDFGSSCFVDERMYSYIQSRFYRAPEIILGLNYGLEIDMWSFGCILAELYTGIPIFPGEDETDQLFYMMEYLGTPPLNLLKISKKKKMFFNDDYTPKKIQNSRGKIRIPNTKNIKKFLINSEEDLLDLIEKCLIWDTDKRITPSEALQHPYIFKRYQREVLEVLNSKYEKNKKLNITNPQNITADLDQQNSSSGNIINNKNNSNNKNHIGCYNDKININININSINNCQVCTSANKNSKINYNHIPVTHQGNLTNKNRENKTNFILNSTQLMTSSQKDKKKTFISTSNKKNNGFVSNTSNSIGNNLISNGNLMTNNNISNSNIKYKSLVSHIDTSNSNYNSNSESKNNFNKFSNKLNN